MTVATERPDTLVPTPDRDVPRPRSTAPTAGGWYDPDSVAWEPDDAAMFEAFRADTTSPAPHQETRDSLTRRSGY